MTAARRLAAILAVDVVGYSRLMGEDEAGRARVHREATRPITFNPTDRFPPIAAIQIDKDEPACRACAPANMLR